jgi:uncharacterized protein (TIRG00374 family)
MAELPIETIATTQAAPRKRKRPLLHAIQIAVSLAIIVAVFAFAIPKLADYSKVWDAVTSLTLWQVLALIGVTLFNIVSYWPQMVASLPGLTIAQAAVNNQSSTTVANTVPGGGFIANGVTIGMFHAWGFTGQEIGLSMLLTAIWNSFIKLGFPVIAVLCLVLTGEATSAFLVPAVIGLVALIGVVLLFALGLWKKPFARRIGELLGKAVSFVRTRVKRPPVHDWGDAAVRFRKRTLRVVSKRWVGLTVSSVVSHLGLYAVLLLSLRFAGVTGTQVSWAQVLAVFAFGRLLTALPLTPGGLGVVEIAYIGGIVLAGHHQTTVPLAEFEAQVTAGVLMFRALTYGAQIPLGILAYGIYRMKTSWRKEVPSHEAHPVAVAAPIAI